MLPVYHVAMQSPSNPSSKPGNDWADAAAAGLSAAQLAAIKALVSSGARIEAIKRWRIATGADLVTAKGAIDAIASGSKLASDGNFGASSSSGWRVQRTIPFTAARAGGALRIMGLFCCLCTLIVATAAAWQAWDRYAVEQIWKQADAEVVRCHTVQRSSRRHDGAIDLWTGMPAGPTLSLACGFRFSVDGQERTAETSSSSAYVSYLTAAMTRWAKDHPPGSRQTIYYDPADPRNISLGGADASFEPDTPTRRLFLASMFAVPGLLILVGGMCFDAVRRRRVD